MKLCLNCENEFYPKRERAKFCSDKCRASFYQNVKGGKMTIRIYKLINPIDKTVFYVGRTVGTLITRLSGHLKDNVNTCKGKILDSILKANLNPIIEEIESFYCTNEEDESAALKKEDYWIRKYIEEGHPLCNVSGVKSDSNHALISRINRDKRKGANISVRCEEDHLKLLMKNEGISSPQKAIDFLLEEYHKLYGPKPESIFKVRAAQIEKKNGVAIGNFELEVDDEPPIELSYNDYLALIPKLETIADCQRVSDDIDRLEFASWQKASLKKLCITRSQHPDLN